MRAARHEFEDHTSEVMVHLQAPDLPGLFHEAGVALAELMAPEAASVRNGDGEPEAIELHARDAAALLVDWIDELIYRVDTSGRVFVDVEVEHAEPTSLRARVRGVTPAEFKTAVKAATFHGLSVEQDAEGYSAHVVVDV